MRIECSFIQVTGVGERTEQSMWEAGITDWRDGLESDILGPKTAENLRTFTDRATEELDAANIAFFAERLPSQARWRLAETFRDRAVALDIDTTGLDQQRDVVTTVSIHGADGTETLVRGRDLTRTRLEAVLDDAGLLVTYNGARFDIPFLEDSFDLSIDCPHLDLMYPCRRLGWTGGLKAVERQLGIERKLPAVDGREAVRLWYKHRDGDPDALDRLIRYNQEDVRTLFPIVDEVVETLDRKVLEPYLS